MAWTYIQSEPGLYTVGSYNGEEGDPRAWQSDSDHHSKAEAAERAAYLNGAAPAHKPEPMQAPASAPATTAAIELIGPSGVPITLHVGIHDDTAAIIGTLERADKIAAHFLARGWSHPTAAQAEAGPSAAELASGPTFAGYPCSPTVDDQGLPTWIIVDGKQAQRREKQGDVWYSVKENDGSYTQVLRIPKGEQAPAVRGL